MTSHAPRVLVAIPVYNEARHARGVLRKVLAHAPNLIVIDDGSTDETPEILREFPITVIRREHNVGYGRSMQDALGFAHSQGYDWLITMDCDDQHEPEAIPRFIAEALRGEADVVSGSRYLSLDDAADRPPADRRAINAEITAEINRRLGYNLTDAFCGFKAYRVGAVAGLTLTENGYAFPMQFWAQAKAHDLRVTEIPVKLIYNDPSRSFGGPLDDPQVRLDHYRRVLHCELASLGLAPDIQPCCEGA